QRVACGGAGYANHAAINFVPRNLCVPIPEGVDSEHAAFATIGAIAMQGYRQSDMQLGEVACVIGLGLIGQLLVQILQAAGVAVIGVDLQEQRLEQGIKRGVLGAFSPDDPDLGVAVSRYTGGRGVDCVFITAGGASNRPIELAAEVARDRARVVDIGKTSLDLDWNDFYDKELDLRFSRSYGPGRYDPNYEERGIDYPAGYVRWTENRNMQSFLELLDRGAIDLKAVIGEAIEFDDAEAIYQTLATNNDALGLVFHHKAQGDLPRSGDRIVWQNEVGQASGAAEGGQRLGVIGAGNYCSSMLLPTLAADPRIQLAAVATSSGLTSKNAANKFAFERATADYKSLFEADDIGSVLIATRHASHVPMVCAGLEAGKNVYVEKPLAIDREGLLRVSDTVRATGNNRLVVGFNRRHAPLVRRMKELLPQQPMTVHYRVQAGLLEAGSWYLDPEEGGRFVGEAGHFFDTLNFLTGADPIAVTATAMSPEMRTPEDGENITATIEYADGSVGCLMYLTQGSPKIGKEYIEAHGGGASAVMNDFRSLSVFRGSQRTNSKASTVDKGQKRQMSEWVGAVSGGDAMPISLD
ncbi:MAG: bi-domain-containing oxidoreductase, partial [Pseudomonadota bacterium]